MPNPRVANLMKGRTPDRLPWLPELNGGFCRKMLGLPLARGEGITTRQLQRRCAAKIGADMLDRVVSVQTIRRQVRVEEDLTTGITVIHTPAGDLRRRQEAAPESGTWLFREYLLKGPESFPAFRAMVANEMYKADYEAAAPLVATAELATIDVPATPLMHILMWEMGVQETLLAMLDHRDALCDLMAIMHEQNKEYYRVAAAGPGTVLRPMEDTSSMLTGPRLYAEQCVGWLNDYADICHQAGKAFIPHMCGHLDGMLDVLADVKLDGVEAVTTPPLGDANLERIRRKLGDIWIIGGVDPSLYATATAEEMRAHVRHTLDVMKGDRRFILGHEEIPVAAKPENVQAVADLIVGTASGFYG